MKAMIIFLYDKTFEGLLTAVFDAYMRKTFPDVLLLEGEPLPLFYDETFTVCTDKEKAERVWKGLEKKLSPSALSCLMMGWLSELQDVDLLLFHYICKIIDEPHSIELNFGDQDVLDLSKIAKKVANERERTLQFIRFQKTIDGTFFSAVEPLYNVLSLIVNHFKDRFSDQKWLIYDLKRKYGYYYDLTSITEVSLKNNDAELLSGKLSESLMDRDEKFFQKLWKEYFKTIAIKERLNPKLHKQNMPVRFWKHLTEKQNI